MELGNIRMLAIGFGVCLCGIMLFMGFIALILTQAKRQSSTPKVSQAASATAPAPAVTEAHQAIAALQVHIRPDLTELGFRMRVSGVGSTLLGRSPNAGTVLALNEYSGVSRFHARLEMKDGALFVSDLASRNGTWVNGHRLQSTQAHELRAGDVLNLGRTQFIVDAVNMAQAQDKRQST